MTAGFLSADEVDNALKRRLGRVYARQRLGIERDHEAQKFGQGLTFFHFENCQYLTPSSARSCAPQVHIGAAAPMLHASGFAPTPCHSPRLPSGFDGFTILHITDLHADISGRDCGNHQAGQFPEL